MLFWKKIGRSASEEVIVQLIYLPVLMYGLDACPLCVSDKRFLDFIITRTFMKMFQTSSVDVVQECQTMFNFHRVSELILERKRKVFLQKFCSCENGVGHPPFHHHYPPIYDIKWSIPLTCTKLIAVDPIGSGIHLSNFRFNSRNWPKECPRWVGKLSGWGKCPEGWEYVRGENVLYSTHAPGTTNGRILFCTASRCGSVCLSRTTATFRPCRPVANRFELLNILITIQLPGQVSLSCYARTANFLVSVVCPFSHDLTTSWVNEVQLRRITPW